jgi:hypothetical protein
LLLGTFSLFEGRKWKTFSHFTSQVTDVNEAKRLMENKDETLDFKRYSAAIEKVLATFDVIQEWQDMISFLTRLIKTLQSFQKFTNIPNKLLIAKRLAQTLNPALPAGVHSKTLEVYVIICKIAGVHT